jgi:Arc/MetJ family transcription regulator
MTAKKTSNRLDNDIADDAVKLLGAKSRREAVDFALQEIVALKRFKKLIRKRAGKLSFDGYKE